jgi:hypothetical protein
MLNRLYMIRDTKLDCHFHITARKTITYKQLKHMFQQTQLQHLMWRAEYFLTIKCYVYKTA